MASSPSSSSAETIPTASSKKMRVRSKSTSAVDDSKQEVPIQSAKRVGNGEKTRFRDGINGTVQNGAESLFMKGPKDKHHDRKSRSGRRGLPKKGNSCFRLQLIILYILRKSSIQSVVYVLLAYSACPWFWIAFGSILRPQFSLVSKYVFRSSWILHILRLILVVTTRPRVLSISSYFIQNLFVWFQ